MQAAVFSADRAYRYRLSRAWGDGARVCFVLLNPSTADETQDDPTIRRCIGYAKDWGFGGLEIVNLFALRSTDPRALYRHLEPEGRPENDEHILQAAHDSELVIVAWGSHGSLNHRSSVVAPALKRVAPTFCLSVLKDGAPGHPLYLPRSAKPQLWPVKAAA